MPEGALVVCCANLTGRDVSQGSSWQRATVKLGVTNLARRSCSLRFRFMAIILHVKFSIRSWFGSCVFVLLYSFHIWVPSGSFFCISSGWSRPALVASSRQSGKTASPRTLLRARWFSTERASLMSEYSQWLARRRVMVRCCEGGIG